MRSDVSPVWRVCPQTPETARMPRGAVSPPVVCAVAVRAINHLIPCKPDLQSSHGPRAVEEGRGLEWHHR